VESAGDAGVGGGGGGREGGGGVSRSEGGVVGVISVFEMSGRRSRAPGAFMSGSI
jgi:hypothetical protein